jgi:hypothetical protein
MPILTIVYVSSVLIAFLSSLKSFRLDFPVHLKLFSCLLGLTAAVELLSALLVYVLHKPNSWLYNFFTLVEFWVYGYYYLQLVRVQALRRILQIFLIIFPIFWVVTVFFIFGFNTWNSYVVIFGSFFSVLFAVMYYHQLIIAREIQSLRRLPEFWIATGMLIFYLGALPYFGMLNFLIKYNMDVARSLLKVLKVLDTLMYLLFSYGFLCRIIITKKSLSS